MDPSMESLHSNGVIFWVIVCEWMSVIFCGFTTKREDQPCFYHTVENLEGESLVVQPVPAAGFV